MTSIDTKAEARLSYYLEIFEKWGNYLADNQEYIEREKEKLIADVSWLAIDITVRLDEGLLSFSGEKWEDRCLYVVPPESAHKKAAWKRGTKGLELWWHPDGSPYFLQNRLHKGFRFEAAKNLSQALKVSRFDQTHRDEPTNQVPSLPPYPMMVGDTCLDGEQEVKYYFNQGSFMGLEFGAGYIKTEFWQVYDQASDTEKRRILLRDYKPYLLEP